MTAYDPAIDRKVSEDILKNSAADFTAKYYAVCHLQSLAEKSTNVIQGGTMLTLTELMKDPKLAGKRQSLFLFRQAAETLTGVIIHGRDPEQALEALSALISVIRTAGGHAHQATCEALGSLPFTISGPEPHCDVSKDIPQMSWNEFLEENALAAVGTPYLQGRSLVSAIEGSDRLLVVKIARNRDSLDNLRKEWAWMRHLGVMDGEFHRKCRLPRALVVKHQPVFQIRNLPLRLTGFLHRRAYCIGFIAPREYFRYPNGISCFEPVSSEDFLEMMNRNAWLLGNLASSGIIHAAPIPLFHNRVQRQRRRDQGLYEWYRAGRLDRWLESCAFPNFGATGIRDFEHLESFQGNARILYRRLGNHFLSLLLVAASHFRSKDVDRVGLDQNGNPVDARDLFAPEILKSVLQGIFYSYYSGFVGIPFVGGFPLDCDKLVCRMIDEMGVDRHMEEILRIADQQQMADDEFKEFLKARGFSDSEIRALCKGQKDIVMNTGPHLGAFNDRISIPELIEAVATMSALCIAGKFFSTRFFGEGTVAFEAIPKEPKMESCFFRI